MQPSDGLRQAEQDVMSAAMERGKEFVTSQDLVEHNEAIAPLVAGNFTVGFVPMVNGTEAEAVPGFVASRQELLVLAKYWMLEKLDAEFGMFCRDQSGSSELRIKTFAAMRINRIADALNDDSAIEKAIDEACEEFSKNLKDSPAWPAWKVFIGKATPDEVARWKVGLEKMRCGDDGIDEHANLVLRP